MNVGALHSAAFRGDLQEVRRLVEAHPDQVDTLKYGYTALSEAALQGDLEVVRYLLDVGAEANHFDAEEGGWPPLLAASSEGHALVVELLLNVGASVDVKEASGCTALHMAIREDVVRALLAAGADPTVIDSFRRTPLEEARELNDQGCVVLMEEWELAYRIVKARRLRDLAAKLSHSKQPSSESQGQRRTPAYLAERVERGQALPEVQLEGVSREGGKQAAKRGHDEGSKCEVTQLVLKHVMGGMKAELVEELKEVMW